MNKLKMLNRIKELYFNNENIISYLKNIDDRDENSIEDILISYDFQAGNYIKGYRRNPESKDEYCTYLANVLNALGADQDTILEVGVGEATTLGLLAKKLDFSAKEFFGFDISWSRIKYAKRFVEELNLKNINLFTGDLFTAPLKDNSIDIVYTSHSIEPNGGKEIEALTEVYRIAKKYVVLLEPSYEFANEEARKRMKSHGYVTNLYETAKSLGYNIIEHRLFEISANPLNPTGLIVIKKDNQNIEEVDNPLCCPITKTDLLYRNNAYFSKESLLSYPVIDDIPCFLPQNAIITTKFLD